MPKTKPELKSKSEQSKRSKTAPKNASKTASNPAPKTRPKSSALVSSLPNKIICWNVNGIRAMVKKGAFATLLDENADIICLQETKAHPEQLPAEIACPPGYGSFFDFSKLKKGYSGVAIYTKLEPIASLDMFSLSPDKYDQEGRFYQLEFPDFVLINCYFPNGGGESHRLDYKLRFYDAFINHIKKTLKSGKELIVCGDFNIVHKEPDAARFKENQGNIGFLPQEREKLDLFLENGLVDVFRKFYPDKKNAYTWWDMKSYARERNIGWRIDTFFATAEIAKKIMGIKIRDDIFGSDHCPVSISF